MLWEARLRPLSILGLSQSDSIMSPDGGNGVTRWVAAQCEPVRLEEASKDERFALGAGSAGIVNSLISFPLQTAGRVVGVVNLSSPASGVFSDQDEEIVSTAAEHIAAALERTRRFDALKLEQTALSEQVGDYQSVFPNPRRCPRSASYWRESSMS